VITIRRIFLLSFIKKRKNVYLPTHKIKRTTNSKKEKKKRDFYKTLLLIKESRKEVRKIPFYKKTPSF